MCWPPSVSSCCFSMYLHPVLYVSRSPLFNILSKGSLLHHLVISVSLCTLLWATSTAGHVWQLLSHIPCCDHCCVIPFLFVSHLLVPAPSKTQLPPRLHHMSTHHWNLQAASGRNLNTKKYNHWLRAALSHKLLECTGKSNYMLTLFFYFFPGHKLLATPTSEIRTLFSCLSWVYSLLILRLLVSWAAGVWILNEHETVLIPVTVDAELQVLVHNPGLGVFFFLPEPASLRVSDPEIPAGWLELQTPLN